MLRNLLDFVCCPKCEGSFEKTSSFLVCRDCKKQYEIVEGVPNLVDLESLDEHNRRQISYFGKGTEAKARYSLQAWQRSYLRRFDESISVSRGEVVVDVGTGSGYMAIDLAKRENTVLACDLNLKGLIRLKKISKDLNLTSNLFLFACSAEKLPIRSDVADVFILNAVLEHLPQEKMAIKEVGRICKKEACGFVTLPIKLRYVWPFFWPMGIIHDKKIGHLRRYGLGGVEMKFERIGFEIERCFYTGHFIKTLGVLVQLLLRTDRWDELLEQADRRGENRAYGANNLIVVLRQR